MIFSENNRWINFVFGTIFIFIVLSIIFVNQWIAREFREVKKIYVPPPVTVSTDIKKLEIKVLPGAEIFRQTKLDPSREYAESVFYWNEQEIARFKSIGEKIYDMTGKIPNGMVKFYDDSNQTSGEEHYEDGKKHGPMKEFYATKEIKREGYYFDGQLMRVNEYFIDGKLRMEADYEDSLFLAENKNVGKGKTYYRSGVLMYEWNLTNRDENRYTKSYNINGELIEIKYFNEIGKLVRVVDPKAPVEPMAP